MSVTNIICQPRHRCVHVMTDAAAYDDDGILLSIGDKSYPMPHWPGVVATRGSAIGGALIAWSLSSLFQNFDDAVDRIAEELPAIVDMFNLAKHHVELIFAGWSSRREMPEAYVIETTAKLPRNFTEEQRAGIAKGTNIVPGEMNLTKLSDVIQGPCLSPAIVLQSGFERFDVNRDPEAAIEALRFTIECQRHDVNPDGRCYVGGFAAVTTVTQNSITQRVLHRWEEDQIGQHIKPLPIDWQAWKAARSSMIPAGLSRLQRERMEKKARKGTLRAV